jgi:protease I
MPDIKQAKILMIATNGFEQSELEVPRDKLREAGAKLDIASPDGKDIKGWDKTDWGRPAKVDLKLSDVKPDDYHALVIPGGVMNPDKLRMNPKAVAFVKAFFDAQKPVGAICHGPWMVIESGAVKGRTVTSWPSLKTDVENAGGRWVDQEAVVDGNLVTSRNPKDIPAFNREVAKLFAARKLTSHKP